MAPLSAWLLVVAVGVATIAIKGAGPVLLGGRPLPPRITGVVALLAPALLAALVATLTIGDGAASTAARLLGVMAAVAGIAVGLPTLAIVMVAAAVTALARVLGMP